MLAFSCFRKGLPRRGLLCGLALGVVGCAPPAPQQVLLATGFEQPAPATSPLVAGMPPAVPSAEQAHSGQYSAKIDANNRNAMLCGSTWQALGRPHHVRLRFWAWLPNGKTNAGVLEVTAQRPAPAPTAAATRLHVQRLPLDQVVRRHRQWTLTTLHVSLPHSLYDSDEVSVSLWGLDIRPGSAIYIDDVSLENAD